LTWHITDKFDATGGARYARDRQTFEQVGTGLLGKSAPTSRSSEHVFTYLANARYHFNADAIGYFRYATGYRPGGPNFISIDATTGLPIGKPTFEADELKSYEVGFKADTSDRRFGIDVASYYIDWSNIQITVTRGGFSARDNAPGGATSRGAELTLIARPTSDFTTTCSIAYQDAEMSQADPNLKAAKGERLPNVPRFAAALNADYKLPVGSLQPTVGTTLRYVSDRTTSFDNSTSQPQYHLPAYTVVDVRAGFAFGGVTTQLYVHNLFDKRAQVAPRLSGATPPGGPYAVSILQPRTIGLTVSTTF
jgi:iron complex outermembrane receptor protein